MNTSGQEFAAFGIFPLQRLRSSLACLSLQANETSRTLRRYAGAFTGSAEVVL